MPIEKQVKQYTEPIMRGARCYNMCSRSKLNKIVTVYMANSIVIRPQGLFPLILSPMYFFRELASAV